MCARDVVFYDPVPISVAVAINLAAWDKHLRFFGRACRAVQAQTLPLAQMSTAMLAR